MHAIIAKNCLACHDEKHAEADLVLESFTTLMAGGDDGKVIIPGNAQNSPLVQQIEHRAKPFMPPPKKAKPLLPEEITVIRSWIDSGALPPKPGEIAVATTLPALPFIAPKGNPRRPVQAMTYSAAGKLLAIARANEVELWAADTQKMVRTLGPHEGNVNAVVFTPDGKLLIAAGGSRAKRDTYASGMSPRANPSAILPGTAMRFIPPQFLPMARFSQPEATTRRSFSGNSAPPQSSANYSATTAPSSPSTFAPMEKCSPAAAPTAP